MPPLLIIPKNRKFLFSTNRPQSNSITSHIGTRMPMAIAISSPIPPKKEKRLRLRLKGSRNLKIFVNPLLSPRLPHHSGQFSFMIPKSPKL
ncbi:hypothetical protein TrLO_g10933 [Triparma laevis f. longispina]|uniref:Uncharacterized protein n=1 Tax=Triparma laevis f. longispina TaxID=1714387 RepID=A0A9W7DYG3_9STRA|nr:hypothetical protein TrLO_g10933 [Triparma laevis f. longispina]